MEPFSTTAVAAAKKLAETKLIEAKAITNAIENDSIAPLGIVASATLADIQLPSPEATESLAVEADDPSIESIRTITNVEYAGLLNGMLDQEANLAHWTAEVGRYYDAGTEKMAALYDLGETKVGELLENSGIKEAAQLGLQDSIQWLEQTTGKDFVGDARELPGTADMVVVYNADHGLSEATDHLARVGTDVTIAVGMHDIATFEQSILQWCDEKGLLLTAKRIDFQIESELGVEYVKGKVTDIPLVGSLANIGCKHQLDVDIVAEDIEQLKIDGVKVGLVITVAILAPILIPGAAVSAGCGAFTMKSAVTGSSIGAICGGLQNGAASVIRGEAAGEVLASTGKGLVAGSVLGAIGGAVSGKVLYHAGASLKGCVAASAAGGSVTSGLMGGVGECVMNPGDLSAALKSAGGAALAGGITGGLGGAAAHGVGRLTSKILPLPDFPEGLTEPSGLMVRSEPVRLVYRKPVLGQRLHHRTPLSLGGTDTAANIELVPISVHGQPHPPYVVRNSPIGTIFFRK